ncbi:phosphatase PAP2 family protein [Horticoccus luteus]|uniref:Acid phosphatase n=1 Tax=Horticoccus luteus TaxID=2862869 RepID=A0A8F9TWW7_9BACT|nr:phosphatase PAP2 family protein [Horticoccus luteus]QYM79491.1 phosphatase PAP2 family protein [Horticoccus luteus]
MKSRFFPAVFALAVILLPVVRGQGSAMAEQAVGMRAPHEFADVSTLEWSKLVPPPPAAESLAAEGDLYSVLQMQAARTPEQIEWAQLVEKGDVFALFGAEGLLGPDFSRENFPALDALLHQLTAELQPIKQVVKEKYQRARPFLADVAVEPCVQRPDSDSYPSGHAFNAHVWARVLAEIFPEQRAALIARADYIGWGRVIGGVHFPTDLVAGRRLAVAVMAREMKNPAFREAIEACRAEAAKLKTKKAA